MAVLPPLIPNKIQIELSDYNGTREDYKNTDIFRYPTQWYNTNNKLRFEYINKCKEDIDLIRNFYVDLQLMTTRVFRLPSIILKNFENNLINQALIENEFWVFDQNKIDITPRFINLENPSFDLNFILRAVIS
jgi:hypothetical protein